MKNIPLHEVAKIKDLREMLYNSADEYKNKAAFLVKKNPEDQYHPIDYIQYKNDVQALGTQLLNMNLKGKRIAVIGENKYQWGMTYLAVMNGIGIIVPIDKELPENEIINCVKRSEASAIIFSGKKREAILSIIDKVEDVEYFIDMDKEEDDEKTLSFNRILDKGYKALSDGNKDYLNLEIDREGVSVILFTSATTSESKAVLLSQRNICENLMSMSSMLYVGPKDTFLSILPIHHTYECTCGFLCAVYRGCTIAFCDGLRHIPKNLKESHTTVILGVPLIFESMHKKIWSPAEKKGAAGKLRFAIKLSNFLRIFGINITKKLFSAIYDNFGSDLRLFISGAAGIDPVVAKGFRDFGISLVQGYGLTECAPIVGLNRGCDFKDDAAGLPLPGLDVKIDNKDNEGIGEIIVKGPSVMIGYYHQPEETEKAFTKDGYFRTGDLGYIDSDGFIHITGRKKNVIVTKNGKNIFPEEIETLLGRSQLIKECMVYGKEEADEETTVAASILPNFEILNEKYSEAELTGEKISELINEEVKNVNKLLTNYKHIKHVTIREKEFIKTTTNKIKRYLEKED